MPVAEALATKGFRVLAPALRGCAGTRFRSPATPRSGQFSALGRDLLEFVEALHISAPVLVGHDWGARAAAAAVGLNAACASQLVLLSVGYASNVATARMSYAQARNYWYHWYMATPKGASALATDRVAFTRFMWDTWSPGKWYDEHDFSETARAFDNPDWVDVVLHFYRHRWGLAPAHAEHDADESRLAEPPRISVPTLVIHGEADACNAPGTSAGKESFFLGRYERVVLPQVGHFPQKEAPAEVVELITNFVA